MTAGVGLKPLDVFTLGLRYLRNSQTDEAREAFRERVRAAARAMTGPEFEAVLTDDAFAHGSEIRAVQLPPEVSSD